VKTQDSSPFSLVTLRPVRTLGWPGHSYIVIFPDEFTGAPPLSAGRYEVEWRRSAVGEPDALAKEFGLETLPPVASTSFEIAD
jgi:hypothetical protein